MKFPYLSIAVTNACNLRCYYCSPDGNNGMGEAYGTKTDKIDLKDLEKKIKIAEKEGVTRVRITGGEPLLVPNITDFFRFLDEQTTMEYAVATNGILVNKYFDELVALDRIDLRISLDSLKPEKFAKICGTSEKSYYQVMNNLKSLSKIGKLHRIASVIGKDNEDEIESLIDFAENMKINLKLFDMYSTPNTKNNWNETYSSLTKIKEIVEKRSVNVRQIEYTKSFGIPALEYQSKKGIKIRIKDSKMGTRYHTDLCTDCNSLPCQEGLYTILYSSSQKLIPCRLSPKHYEADTTEKFKESLRFLIDIFKNSYHDNKYWRK